MAQHPDIRRFDENDGANRPYSLRLFVAGASINSLRAVNNIKEICETHLEGNYILEIVDVYQQKNIAESENIIALPLLIVDKNFSLTRKKNGWRYVRHAQSS